MAAGLTTADCPDCDLSLDLEPAVTDNADCSYELISMGEADYPISGLDFYSTYTVYGYYGNYYYYNVTFLEYSYEYYGYEYDSSAAVTYEGYYGSSYLTASFDGSTLEWGGTVTASEDLLPGADCGGLVESTSTEAYPGGFTGSYVEESTLDCDGLIYDAWSFDASAGDTVEITVDTTDADTAFDPVMVIHDESACWVGAADDNFDCEYAPTAYQCPSQALDIPADGTYTVVVWSYGSCVDTAGTGIGDYSITVNNAGSALTQTADDAPLQAEYTNVYSATVAAD